MANMHHSIQLTGTEDQILKKIALSSYPVSAFELADELGKNYSNIHRACKRLIGGEILTSEDTTNERNAPKKVFKFTLFGFCVFVTKSGWFFGETQNEEFCQQFLKNWKYLHESIECYYTYFLRVQTVEKSNVIEDEKNARAFMGLYLHRMYFACTRIIERIYEDVNYSTSANHKLTLQEVIRFNGPESGLYLEIFDELTQFFNTPRFAEELDYPIDEVLDFFRKSKGYEMIKQSLKLERMTYEAKLYCYNNF